jgi:hypothetical protein
MRAQSFARTASIVLAASGLAERSVFIDMAMAIVVALWSTDAFIEEGNATDRDRRGRSD